MLEQALTENTDQLKELTNKLTILIERLHQPEPKLKQPELDLEFVPPPEKKPEKKKPEEKPKPKVELKMAVDELSGDFDVMKKQFVNLVQELALQGKTHEIRKIFDKHDIVRSTAVESIDTIRLVYPLIEALA